MGLQQEQESLYNLDKKVMYQVPNIDSFSKKVIQMKKREKEHQQLAMDAQESKIRQQFKSLKQ